MIKITLITLCTIVMVVAMAAMWLWWIGLKHPPSYGLIEQKYYVCRVQKALNGGIFGKGPLKAYYKDQEWCWRKDWEEIERDEFKALATKWYGVDWSVEIDYWNRDSEP